MPTGDWTAIRDGLKTNLATISGLRAFDTIPGKLNPPCAVVGYPESIRDVSLGRGKLVWQVPVRVYVARADVRAAQDNLDVYLTRTGAKSIWAALENDRTLAGAADTLHVVEVRQAGEFVVADVVYLGFEALVEVWA